jgi:hypothetical protein
MTAASLAGGATVVADDGTAFIVGGTRMDGDPTAAVLRVSPQGDLTSASLTAPRLGASAAWVAGVGLVVAGGNATATVAGVETLAATGTLAVALPYPADATTGAGMGRLDASHVVLGGGTPATDTRVVNLTCGAACNAAPWAESAPAMPLVRAQIFATDASNALLVGEDANGATHAFHVGWSMAQESTLRVPRNHARAVLLPTGAIAVVGGDTQIESFFP